jgi:hypothetical protein
MVPQLNHRLATRQSSFSGGGSRRAGGVKEEPADEPSSLLGLGADGDRGGGGALLEAATAMMMAAVDEWPTKCVSEIKRIEVGILGLFLAIFLQNVLFFPAPLQGGVHRL